MDRGRSEWRALATTGLAGLAGGLALGYVLAGGRCRRDGSAAAEPPEPKAGACCSGRACQGQSSAAGGVGAVPAPDRVIVGKVPRAASRRTGELLTLFSQLPERTISRQTGGDGEHAFAVARAVFMVASGKGGVGKSTISVNLAFSLKHLGLRVGILDLDIYGPSLPEQLPMPPNSLAGTEKGHIVPYDYGDVGLMSWGYIQPGQAVVIRAPIATRCASQLLTMVNWGNLDCLIIDTPPGTGDVLLTLTQMVQIDGAVLVTTGNEMSVADLCKGAELLEKVSVPVLTVCQNMAALPCSKCGHENELFEDEGSAKIPQLLSSLPSAELHKIPLDPRLSVAPAQPVHPRLHQYPYVSNPDYDDRPASKALQRLAEGLLSSFLAVHSQSGEKADLRVRSGGSLQLRLPGGALHKMSCQELRASCRCAECVDEFTGEQRLDRERVLRDTSLKAQSVEPVGNYGVQVVWSDGHSSLLSLKMMEQMATAGSGSGDGGGAKAPVPPRKEAW